MEEDNFKMNLKQLKEIVKSLYKCDIFMENFFDVVLQHILLCLLYNIFSKQGLTFIATGLILGFLNITPVKLSILIGLFPSIVIISNIPILYIVNSVKLIKNIKEYEKDSTKTIIENDKKEQINKEELIKTEDNNHIKDKPFVRVRTK